MAKRYTATAQLRCQKQHTCSSCTCVYSYFMDRKVVGSGTTPEKADANLQVVYQKTLREENDMHPCPNCGQYQQDMIGLRLAKKRKTLALIAIVMPILVPILRATDVLQSNTLAWLTVFYCAGFVVAELFLTLRDPNSDREANRGVAAERMVQGTIQVQPMASPNPDTPALDSPARSMGHIVTLALLAGTVLLAALPEMIRVVNRWPLNEACYPPVVGPSDATRIYMNQSISSIKGYWRGVPNVLFQAEGQAEPVRLNARTKDNDWGSSIYAKSSEKSSSNRPWVEFHLPDTADLAGKTATAHVDLRVEYPQMVGSSNFETVSQQMGREVSIRLASAGAGAKYNSSWWTFITTSLLIVLGGSIALVYVARRYERRANPAQATPIKAV